MSTDDLLDRALGLAERLPVLMGGSIAETLRALVERIRELEAERESWHQAALTATAGESRAERERDEARGKLNKVRARLDSWDATALRDVLAILDD